MLAVVGDIKEPVGASSFQLVLNRAGMLAIFLTVAGFLYGALSQATGAPTITIQTSTPTPTAPVGNTVPSQAALPPKQAWCPSEIFCAGSVSSSVPRFCSSVESTTM